MEYICHSWRCVVEESANPRLQQSRPPQFVKAETSLVGPRPGRVRDLVMSETWSSLKVGNQKNRTNSTMVKENFLEVRGASNPS
jgi:hypothetical protein